MFNHTTLVGRVTQEPEAKRSSAGSFYHQIFVATDRDYITKSGERKRESDVIKVIVWNKEWIGTEIKSGDLVVVEGRLQNFVEVDAQSGKRYVMVELLAQYIRSITRYEAAGGKHRALARGEIGKSSFPQTSGGTDELDEQS